MTRFRVPLTLIAIIGVLVIAWAVHWRAVTLLPIDYDEDDYLRAAQEFAALVRNGNWAGFMETNYRLEHPPLQKIIFGFSILSAPETPLLPDLPTTANPTQTLPIKQVRLARTASMVFGLIEVGLLALVNPLAGLLLAVHTFTIKYTSQIMLESLPAFTSLAVVLCYISSKKSRRKTIWMGSAAVFLGLTAASKYLYAVIGFAVLIDWFLSERQNNPTYSLKRYFLKALLWGVIAFTIFIIADPYLWPDPLGRLKETILYHAAYSTGAAEVQDAGFPFWQPFVWLFTSVPWHPGVFVVSPDMMIAVFGLAGIQRLWKRERVFVLWLLIGMGFLLVWPTKWPQYILLLTAPLSLAAVEGIRGLIIDPVTGWWANRRKPKTTEPVPLRNEIKTAAPWLIPGLVALAILTLFPLFYQFAMSFTDFNSMAIRDGISGGVWRAVWEGITGQVQAVNYQPFGVSRYATPKVGWAGPGLLLELLTGATGDILVFNLIWATVSVFLQAALGISLALLLNRRGLKLAKFWQTLFILPWAIPEFIGALIWLRTFQPRAGWIEMALPQGVPTPENFNNPTYALFVLLIAATWYGFPFIMLAASASLKLVPVDVYDAAAMDGAHGWSLFREVTWPLLLPLVAPALIIRGIFAFNQFYLFYVMNTNYPTLTMSSLSYFIFTYGNQYAASAVINIFSVVVLIVMIAWFNRWSKAAEGVTYA